MGAEKFLKMDAIDPRKPVKVQEIKTDEHGALLVDRRRSVRVDHAGAANMVMKHINIVPNLSPEARMIMSLKVMNPGLSNLYIAREMRLSLYDVLAYEQEGINKCAQHLKQMRLKDSVEKFNLDATNTEQIKNLNLDKHNPIVTGINQNQ